MQLQWWEPFERSMSELGVETLWLGEDLATIRDSSPGSLSGLVVELSPDVLGEEPQAVAPGRIPWAGVPVSPRSADIAQQVGIDQILWGEDEAKRWLELCRAAGPPGRAPMVVIAGTGGAPGASTLAIAVASLVAESHRVVLLDADCVAPSLAQMLELPEESSGLLGALRVARNNPPSLESILACARVVEGHQASLFVLSGAHPGALDCLEASAVAPLVECFREAGFCVVAEVKAAPVREDKTPESDMVDALLSAATRVIAVARDSDLGVSRFVRLWESSDSLRDSDDLVVLCRPRSVRGGEPPSESPRALWELTGVEKISWLPDREGRDWGVSVRNLVADLIDVPTTAGSRLRPTGGLLSAYLQKHLSAMWHKPLP
jgi:hypothetical protein